MNKKQLITISIKIVTYIFLIWILGSGSGFSSEKYKEFSELSDKELSKAIPTLESFLEKDSDDTTLLKFLGIAYHQLARADKKKYASKTIEILTKAHGLNKQDDIILCYLGSATTMMAETTWRPMKKMSYVNKGVAYMDKAVKRNPEIVRIRFTRAYNSLALPGFLNRREVAITDFEYLYKLIETDPNRYYSIKQKVLENLIKIYKEDGDAEKEAFYSKKLKEK